MTNVVESYRRSHADAAPRKSRRWLATGVVLGLMASSGLVAAMATGGIESPPFVSDGPMTPNAPAHRFSANENATASDTMAVGSTSKLPHPFASRGVLDGPITGLIIAGVGLLTGLMVYLGLGRLLPANEPAPHPYELVRGRKDIVQERRYHGGPIRD